MFYIFSIFPVFFAGNFFGRKQTTFSIVSVKYTKDLINERTTMAKCKTSFRIIFYNNVVINVVTCRGVGRFAKNKHGGVFYYHKIQQNFYCFHSSSLSLFRSSLLLLYYNISQNFQGFTVS